MGQTSFRLDDEIEADIENRLSYSDTKTEFFTEAAKMKLAVDPILDEVYEPYQNEERLELVEKAVREKVDELKRENGK